MTDKIKELLGVLDLTEEDKQLMWLKEHREEFGIDNHPASYLLEGFPRAAKFFLADLAFRLRDEVGQGRMFDDLNIEEEVYEYVLKERANPELFLSWWICHSQPIHFIIAALIAKAKDG